MAPLTVLLEAITISMHIIMDTREGAENIIFHPNNIALYIYINSCTRFYESTRTNKKVHLRDLKLFLV